MGGYPRNLINASDVYNIATIKYPSFPPWQIHWPVSERRRMECLVSGKDANVSKPADSLPNLNRVIQQRLKKKIWKYSLFQIYYLKSTQLLSLCSLVFMWGICKKKNNCAYLFSLDSAQWKCWFPSVEPGKQKWIWIEKLGQFHLPLPLLLARPGRGAKHHWFILWFIFNAQYMTFHLGAYCSSAYSVHCVSRMSVQTSSAWSSHGTALSCMSVGQELTIQSVPLSTVDANLRLGWKTYGMYKRCINI